MKSRDLLLGIGLAVALGVGFVLTRDSGLGDATAVDLDITSADGELSIEGIAVTVVAEPRPLRVFDRMRFTFRFTEAGEVVEVAEPRIDFNMVMDMGPHGYRLVQDEAGSWVAEDVVLPQCGSGSRLWFGELTFAVQGEPHSAQLRLELDPPGSE